MLLTVVIFVVLFFAAAYAVGNAVRGGWRPHWSVFYTSNHIRKDPSMRVWWDESDELFDALHLITLALPIRWHAIGAAVGNHLGSGPGWGEYIGTYLTGKFKYGTPQREVAVIDHIIRPLASDPIKYALAGMALRGLLWTLCVAVGLLLVSLITDFDLRMFVGCVGYIFMPVGFILSKKFASPSNAWLIGEVINGAFIGTGWGIVTAWMLLLK